METREQDPAPVLRNLIGKCRDRQGDSDESLMGDKGVLLETEAGTSFRTAGLQWLEGSGER